MVDVLQWDVAHGYGEPGYSNDGVTAVVLGNYWIRENGNLTSIFAKYPRITAALEKAGFQFEWEDEWVTDWESSSGLVYRTEPDSYSWQPSIVWTEGGMITPEDDAETWIEWAMNEPTVCIPDHIWEKYESDFADLGWERLVKTFENGWHPGQTDDPKKIFALLKDSHDVIFRLDGTGQFDVRFSAWTRRKDYDDQM